MKNLVFKIKKIAYTRKVNGIFIRPFNFRFQKNFKGNFHDHNSFIESFLIYNDPFYKSMISLMLKI